ncbi:MAG: Holliday junction resolvase RuvX [Deltaproteobacteria bacterium]|nr:Holliday junction resolvase RuvX [Deltaproteobacteria bacterium]
MPRILALDVGEKRVGVAVTDPLGLTAQPLKVLPRRPHGAFLESVAGLCREYEVELVVLGLPRRTDGRLGPEAQRVLALAHQFRSRLGLVVTTWEEWLTTAQAERVLKSDGLNSRQRREVVDKMAATLILQGYLSRPRVDSPAPVEDPGLAPSLDPGPAQAQAQTS